MEPFIGQVMMFAGNYAPRGWAFCNGQLLSIKKYTALYSIIGNTYGGDGRTTFALPDLRGRTPVHPGEGEGLTRKILGEKRGSETHTLVTTEMPKHKHDGTGTILASNANAEDSNPEGKVLSVLSNNTNAYAARPTARMQENCVEIITNGAGNGVPHNNMQPYLAINVIIALDGIYPPRS